MPHLETSLLLICILSWLAMAERNLCNPRTDEGCVARNPAISGLVVDPLTRSSGSFESTDDCPHICFQDEETRLGILNRFDNPRLSSPGYILYGQVEADILGAEGTGIISSFYLQSDDLDEIDIAEVFGGNDAVYQTNFFNKGDVSTFGESGYHALPSSPFSDYHRYGVRWTSSEIEWLLDGKVIRRKKSERIPHSPMRVIISLWVGGDSTNEQGTVAWAGGLTDFEQLPFYMYVKNVSVENYSNGDFYVYGEDGDVSVEFND